MPPSPPSLLQRLTQTLVGKAQAAWRQFHPPTGVTASRRKGEYLFKNIVVEDIPVHTEDDFRLTITNKHPKVKNPDLCPIFCLPGLCENRFVLDQALGNSLVDYLALSGFDVYVGELRGHGKSWHPRERYDWNLDTYLHFDLPAILHKIRQVSGQEQVVWIGHSMGGMLFYAYLIEAALHTDPDLFDEKFIRAGVTIGSPVSFERLDLLLLGLIYKNSLLLKRLPFVPSGWGANLLSLFPGILESSLTQHMWNPANIESRNKILYLKDGMDNVAQGIINDFTEFLLSGSFQSSDGRVNYRENLYLIRTPMLILGGHGDLLAPESTTRTVFEDIASADKELRLFGTEGYLRTADGTQVPMRDQYDYGHVDLTLGRASKSEVWPYILSWIRERALLTGAAGASETVGVDTVAPETGTGASGLGGTPGRGGLSLVR